MKVHFPLKKYDYVFSQTLKVLHQMKFVVQSERINIGIISAFKKGRTTRLINVFFKSDKNGILLQVMPGLASGDFQSICYDEKTAHDFMEHLLDSLQSNDEINSFVLKSEDYLSAISV